MNNGFILLHNTLSVFRFELSRTLTVYRIGVWLLLVLFPVFLVTVMKRYEDSFEGGTFGKRQERPIQLRAEGVTINIFYRHGRREAEVRLGPDRRAPVIRGVPIPNDLSREEIEKTYKQILADYQSRPRTEAADEPRRAVDDTVWGWVFMGLLPGVVTLLGLLLWATPVVQAELEGRTWIYLAVRPRGRASVLLGKYLSAVTWTMSAAWTSATLCILIAQPVYAMRLWSTLMAIIGFSCIGYGALYSLIGVTMQRRAMVIAVAYTLIFEFLVSFVPAVINQFTVHYRLRNLFVRFMEWGTLLPEDAGEVLLGDQPAWLHIVILVAFTLTLLIVALIVIQRKEYATADEA